MLIRRLAGWVPNDSKAPSEASSSYWRMHQESPITPAFSPYPSGGQLSHSATWPHPVTEASAREEVPGWSVPQRSISYGHHEGLHNPPAYPNYHHSPIEPNGRDEYTHRPPPPVEAFAPTMAQPNVSVSANTDPAISASSHEPASHIPVHSQLPPPYPNPQPWSSYPYRVPALGSSGEPYQPWYGQNPALPAHSPAGEGMPPPAYGHVENYGGVYYPGVSQGGR